MEGNPVGSRDESGNFSTGSFFDKLFRRLFKIQINPQKILDNLKKTNDFRRIARGEFRLDLREGLFKTIKSKLDNDIKGAIVGYDEDNAKKIDQQSRACYGIFVNYLANGSNGEIDRFLTPVCLGLISFELKI
ncbi:MAG: hypothetical protein CK427_16680 [Leptospira sp.]|nr:MAG: hypothetical protein CK427_16680 [Leptospira sp.]